jgi:hypothetical protein
MFETCLDAGTDLDASKNQPQTVLACGGSFRLPEIKIPKMKLALLYFTVIMGTPARNQEASLAMKIQQASTEELANEDVGLQCHGQVSRLQALPS